MNQKDDLQVLYKGQPVEFSFFVLKNGGATLGLKKATLNGASKTTKKSASKKAAKPQAIPDGVRFEGNDTAIIRLGGVDVDTITRPTVAKGTSTYGQSVAFRKAINSRLWNTHGGNESQTVWDLRVVTKDIPQ